MVNVRISGSGNYLEKIVDLKIIGFLKVLESYPTHELITCEDIEKHYNLNIEQIKSLLLESEEANILAFQTEVLDSDIIIDIKFVEPQPLRADSMLEQVFGFSSEQIVEVDSLANGDLEKLKNNFTLLFTRNQLPTTVKNVEINTKEQYVEFLNKVYVQDVFNSYGCTMNTRDFEFFYKLAVDKQVSNGVINLLVDYTIKTSAYNSFSINFAQKVIETWVKISTDDVITLVDYIKTKSEEISRKKLNDKYVAPEFDKVEISEEALKSDIGIEDLIDNVYGR